MGLKQTPGELSADWRVLLGQCRLARMDGDESARGTPIPVWVIASIGRLSTGGDLMALVQRFAFKFLSLTGTLRTQKSLGN